jgi:hypothetical protein
MRKILEKLLEKGFKVSFSEEAGVPVLQICKADSLVYTCKLGIGRFEEDIEETLAAALMKLERE